MEQMSEAVARFHNLSEKDKAMFDRIRTGDGIGLEVSEELAYSGFLQFTGIPKVWTIYKYGEMMLAHAARSPVATIRYEVMLPASRVVFCDMWNDRPVTHVPKELIDAGLVEDGPNGFRISEFGKQVEFIAQVEV